ncbi:hypothetical protein T492DRAFT_849911 [Pavlovales sp. CCMP2436]|nr:hypothetical protein T492DRAFT_849911 [Pavlovales sp. CCMP2436]
MAAVETWGSSSTVGMEIDWSLLLSGEEETERTPGVDGKALMQTGGEGPRRQLFRCHVEQHQRTHTGERPFVCGFSGCAYEGKREDGLQRHQARPQFLHHKIKPSTAAAATAAAAKGGASAPSARGAASSLESPFTPQEVPCLQPTGGASGSSTARREQPRVRAGHRRWRPRRQWSRGRQTGHLHTLDYIARDSSRFREHACVHSGERPYACNEPGCTQRTTSQSNLKKHKLRWHKLAAEGLAAEGLFDCDEPGCTCRPNDEVEYDEHMLEVHYPGR